MDMLMGGLKKAADEIDKKAGLSGNDSLGKLADKAKQSYDGAVGNANARSASAKTASDGKTTPANVLASGEEPIGAYRRVTNEYADVQSSFELPESFTEFESYAEPEMCYLYMYDSSDAENIDLNKPFICITPENYAYRAVESFLKTGKAEGVSCFEPVSGGKMLFKAKNVDYFGQVVYFYGFARGNEDGDYMGLAMTYCRDVVGTPLEKKLMSILDHAAETYEE